MQFKDTSIGFLGPFRIIKVLHRRTVCDNMFNLATSSSISLAFSFMSIIPLSSSCFQRQLAYLNLREDLGYTCSDSTFLVSRLDLIARSRRSSGSRALLAKRKMSGVTSFFFQLFYSLMGIYTTPSNPWESNFTTQALYSTSLLMKLLENHAPPIFTTGWSVSNISNSCLSFLLYTRINSFL